MTPEVCTLCGKRALYRWQNALRCTEHRYVLSHEEVDKKRHYESLSTNCEQNRKREDVRTFNQQSGKTMALAGRRKK